MGYITQNIGWPWAFGFMGALGIIVSAIWLKVIRAPARSHPSVNKAELDYIAEGGGLVNMDSPTAAAKSGAKWDYIRQMFASRMMTGIFLGQFCINALTYFFITWFPVYLVKERGLSILNAGIVASIPAICGFTGGILGGVISRLDPQARLVALGRSQDPDRHGHAALDGDGLLQLHRPGPARGVLHVARLLRQGRGRARLGGHVGRRAEEITGLAGGVFNMCGNLSSISTPIIIGYIIQTTGSFNGALVFVATNGLIAAASYLLIVGKIERLELKK